MRGAELLLNQLVDAGGAVWRASWQASVLAVLVLAVHLILGKRLSARWRHAMWLLVLVRLALPVVPSSPLSVFNLASAVDAPATTIEPLDESLTHRTPPAASQFHVLAKPQATSAAPSLVATNPWMGWPRLLAAVWLAGACVLALRVGWATWRVSRAMRRLKPIDDDATLALLRRTAGELGARRLPRLLTGDGLFSPALVGFVRPRVLIPRDLLDRFDAAELRLIFLHELAHMKRRDVATNWAATLLSILHWPNPVVWLVAWRLRIERELACDELVMSRTTDADRRAYGRTIVKLLEAFSRLPAAAARPLHAAGGVGILEGKHQMKRRITMIAQFARSTRTWTAVAVMLVLILGLVALTDAVQAEAPAATTRPAAIDSHGREVEAERPVPGREFTAARSGAIVPEGEATSGAIKSGDLLAVSIMNLVGEGVETVKTSRVDGEGNISLPYVGQVKVQGLKPHEVEKAVAKAFSDKAVVRDALVVVSLPERGESHQLAGRRQFVAEAVAAPLVPGGFAPAAMDPAMADPMALAIAPAAPPAPPVDPAIQAVLDKQLPEVKFENVPFSDVMDFLRDTTSSNLFVNWRGLEEAGIDRAAPVSLNVRNVAFKDVLALVLKQQGAAGTLQFGVENGVITIDAARAAPAKTPKLITKAYDVRDLMAQGGGGGGGMFGGEQGVDSIKSLMMTIYETVSPESWRAQGGSGSLSAYGTKLIVTANDDVHRNVVSLLEMLRENPQPAAATTTKPAAVHEAH